jgi:hypothetical protein
MLKVIMSVTILKVYFSPKINEVQKLGARSLETDSQRAVLQRGGFQYKCIGEIDS